MSYDSARKISYDLANDLATNGMAFLSCTCNVIYYGGRVTCVLRELLSIVFDRIVNTKPEYFSEVSASLTSAISYPSLRPASASP